MSPEATYDENVSIKTSFENMKNAESVAWRPDKPHNQLPPLPPPQELESRTVLKACITARAALAELKKAAELIPNQTMLDLPPTIRTNVMFVKSATMENDGHEEE